MRNSISKKSKAAWEKNNKLPEKGHSPNEMKFVQSSLLKDLGDHTLIFVWLLDDRTTLFKREFRNVLRRGRFVLLNLK